MRVGIAWMTSAFDVQSRELTSGDTHHMAVTLRRQLSDQEKELILKRHGRKCFATGHEIPADDQVQFDHIIAFSRGGVTELENIAPMCAQHNKEKGALPLQDFRTKLRLEEFFASGDKLTLKHLLEYMKAKSDIEEFGSSVVVKDNNGAVTVESASSKPANYAAYTCPATGWRYFYATLDVRLLDSDDEQDNKIGLQPRYLILDRVFELYRHFQQHPVLQPSIGRVVGSHIRLFDGQHKTAALLWNGRRIFECKIYLDPDLRLLNQTNISAHDKFAQVRFYASVMVMKLGTQFGIDFEKYKGTENGEPKTEAGFMEFLGKQDYTLTKAQLNQRFRSFLFDSILKAEDNRLSQFVSETNRGTEAKPLTIDLLKKSIFANFVYQEPTEHNMVTDTYLRDEEVTNVVALMNALNELALSHWNAKAGANDETQRRLERMFRSKSMMAWSEVLRAAILAKIELHSDEDRAMPFYRKLPEQQVEQIKKIVARLVTWKGWQAPKDDEIDRVLSDNKSEVKDWFRRKGLDTGYLMGATE